MERRWKMKKVRIEDVAERVAKLRQQSEWTQKGHPYFLSDLCRDARDGNESAEEALQLLARVPQIKQAYGLLNSMLGKAGFDTGTYMGFYPQKDPDPAYVNVIVTNLAGIEEFYEYYVCSSAAREELVFSKDWGPATEKRLYEQAQAAFTSRPAGPNPTDETLGEWKRVLAKWEENKKKPRRERLSLVEFAKEHHYDDEYLKGTVFPFVRKTRIRKKP
jgi:hypothetical protein